MADRRFFEHGDTMGSPDEHHASDHKNPAAVCLPHCIEESFDVWQTARAQAGNAKLSPPPPIGRRSVDFSRNQALTRGFYCAVAVALFAVALACQGGLEALLLARLQIESVPLNFLDDVLLQDFTLEAPQRVFQRFTFL